MKLFILAQLVSVLQDAISNAAQYNNIIPIATREPVVPVNSTMGQARVLRSLLKVSLQPLSILFELRANYIRIRKFINRPISNNIRKYLYADLIGFLCSVKPHSIMYQHGYCHSMPLTTDNGQQTND